MMEKKSQMILGMMPTNVVVNILLVYLCYAICRVAFVFVNQDILSLSNIDISSLICGGFIFDTSAICYTNALYLVLATFPLHYKQNKLFLYFVKYVFIVVNAVCILANLMDAVYFFYTHHRATFIIFEEFQAEDNMMKIMSTEMVSYFYLVVLAILMIVGIIKFYRPLESAPKDALSRQGYYLRHIISLVIAALLVIVGMRGCRVTTATRPISMNDAMQYVNNATAANVVLNTPFCIIRTSTETTKTPVFYSSQEELDDIYTPIHIPADSAEIRRKNVVILIVESFAQEFIGALNTSLGDGTYKGYTPFTDSLLNVCLSYEQSFANSGFSIDAMPAVLASIPRMDNPYVVSPYSLNHLRGIPSLLGDWGYQSAFFHGAENSSLGFQSFARSIGYQDYCGRTEYEADTLYGGTNDFDGTWAIWDEEYLQYFCKSMSSMKEPFLTTVFTATSHHPFALPERYRNVFLDEGLYPLHKCIRYTDYSLRRFFETARQQPWYENTIFVLTADHASSRITHDVYKTEVGLFRIPILFFDPSGEMPRGRRKGIIQQIDIMPTLLGWLGYDRSYLAFGKDVLGMDDSESWAMNWDHLPQYLHGDYVLQHDGTHPVALYNYKTDSLMQENLLDKNPETAKDMQRNLEAFIQSYFTRMKSDSLIVK